MINDRIFFSVPGNGEVCVIQGWSSRIDTLSNHSKYGNLILLFFLSPKKIHVFEDYFVSFTRGKSEV